MSEYRHLLRISCWVAAIADFIIALSVMIPERMGVSGFVYPMAKSTDADPQRLLTALRTSRAMR